MMGLYSGLVGPAVGGASRKWSANPKHAALLGQHCAWPSQCFEGFWLLHIIMYMLFLFERIIFPSSTFDSIYLWLRIIKFTAGSWAFVGPGGVHGHPGIPGKLLNVEVGYQKI